jgi:hydroxypyruvate isomerase
MIGHVQIAAVPLRHEPTTGELDDAKVLHHLDDLNYSGFVGLEYRPQGKTIDGLTWLSKI